MRSTALFVLAILASLAAFPAPAAAQKADPSEMFLNAYLAVQQAEKLERGGQNEEALTKFRYAASLLDQVAQKHRDWQPLIVDYRRQKTAEAVRRIEDKIALEGPGPSMPEGEELAPSGRPIAPLVTTVPPVANLSEATSGIRDRMNRLQQELEQSREQMSMLQRDKRELTQRLEDVTKRADSAQVTEAELRSQLQQAQNALQNAISDQTSGTQDVQKLQKQVDDLSGALEKARVERDAADELAGNLTEQQKDLREQLKKAQEDLAKAREGKDTQEVQQLEKQIAQLKDALQEVRAERDAADELSGALRTKLATERTQTTEKIAAVTAERDKALASLESLRKSQSDVTQLMADNEALTRKLSDAEVAIANFKQEMPKKDEEIASLKQEISLTKTALEQAQKESAQYQTAMVDLQKRLDDLRAAGSEGLTRENEMLRGIVLRQLKEQARRDQAKKLVLAELAKLEVRSDALLQQIDYLGQPVTKLSQEERALFKQPQIEILDETEPSSMAISIAAAKESPAAVPTSPFDEPVPAPAADAKPGSSLLEQPAGLGEPTSPAPHVDTVGAPNVPAELLPVAKEARSNFEKGNYRDAEKLYEKIISQAPTNLYALSNLGVARFRGGKLRLAEEAFKKAIAIDPDDAFSHRTLGIVFYSQGKYDDAIDELTKALAVSPKDAIAHNYLGIAASQKGWPEAAQKEMETAVALEPKYADAHFNLAVIHISAKPPRKEKAREHYKLAVELGAEPDTTLEQLLK